jgi:uncharacterized protein YggT (Ycf19 family)
MNRRFHKEPLAVAHQALVTVIEPTISPVRRVLPGINVGGVPRVFSA